MAATNFANVISDMGSTMSTYTVNNNHCILIPGGRCGQGSGPLFQSSGWVVILAKTGSQFTTKYVVHSSIHLEGSDQKA